MKIVRNPNRWLKKLSRAAALISLVAGSQAALAQDGAFNYGRTPSGSASEVVDSNRQGLGVLFRGGHMAGDTVGRDDSISHMSLAPYVNIDNSFLFGDSRLVRANGGGLAWTFGGGYRYYLESYDIVLGANSYFDRSELEGAPLNQWGVGAEALAYGWEWRGNLYQTFGETSRKINERVAPNSAAFLGNNITYTRIDTFAASLKGFDTEVGTLLPGSFAERIDLRAFGGGYMYEGESIDAFGGLSGRLQADIGRWLELGLKVTDDEKFKTTVMFSAAVHFGGFESQEHTRRSAIQRFREPVRRNMHVVALQTDVSVGGQLAINPLTGLPYTVAHVNSNDVIGPFNGTVENPFQLLSAGLADGKDITFVHAGSVFNAPPENLISLNPGTQLIGEGNMLAARDVTTIIDIQALGRTLPLTMPNSPTFANDPTLLRPTLSGAAGNGVEFDDNTLLSGFIIDGAVGHGLYSDGKSGVRINDVLVQNSGLSAIRLDNTVGTTSILNTTLISTNGGAPTFHANSGTGVISFGNINSQGVADPFGLATITNSSAGFAAVQIEGMTGGSVNMTGGRITDNGGNGIIVQNNAGNATFDNFNSTNSGANGILVQNSGGTYRFNRTDTQNTTTMLITNAQDQAILFDNFTGTAVFQTTVDVNNRNAEGIEARNSSGTVTFRENVAFDGIGAGIGQQAAVSMHDQLAGGSLIFEENLTVAQGAVSNLPGNGILVTNNAAATLFSVEGNTVLNQPVLAGVSITNNSGNVSFTGSTTINSRSASGIQILDNPAGSVSFGNVAINNPNASQQAAVDVQRNTATTAFGDVQISDAEGNAGGGAGVNLIDNIGNIVFQGVDITSINGGVGLFGFTNTFISISGGQIDSTGAAAVNIEESGININLVSVSSSGSPDFGIRLVETNKVGPTGQNWKRFRVDPVNLQNNVAGSGGTITDAKGDGIDNVDNHDAAGVYLENAGQVYLQGMNIVDNEFGIIVRNTEVAGVPDTLKQELILETVEVSDSDIRGLDARDLMRLEIAAQSIFLDNGDDAANGFETIALEYTTRLDPIAITRFDQAVDEFVVLIENSTISSSQGDGIYVNLTPAVAQGAALQFDMFNNQITVSDTADSTNTSRFDDDRILDDAIRFNWNGPVSAKFLGNTFDLGATQSQSAILFDNRNATDATWLAIQGNDITINNSRVQVGAIDINLSGPALLNNSEYSISNNQLNLDSVGRAIGMRLSLAENSGVNFVDNGIQFNQDAGTGILLTRVYGGSNLGFSGNTIQLSDFGAGPERGIIIQQVLANGNLTLVNLFGNSSADQNNISVFQTNLQTGGNGNVETLFSVPANTSNGQVNINGNLLP